MDRVYDLPLSPFSGSSEGILRVDLVRFAERAQGEDGSYMGDDVKMRRAQSGGIDLIATSLGQQCAQGETL
jgi:hypothetical protein